MAKKSKEASKKGSQESCTESWDKKSCQESASRMNQSPAVQEAVWFQVIQIKAFYGDWRIVTKEEAVAFVKLMIDGFQAISSTAKKYQRINEKHIKGITVEELKDVL